MEIPSINVYSINRVIWKLKLANVEINFQNALIEANKQLDIYPPRLAAMVMMWFKHCKELPK